MAKKKPSKKKKKVSKYHEKIKIDGSFDEVLKAMINTPKQKASKKEKNK
ncbi:MAG: hypothetical protein FD123_363 [Bacteroidetes bacterium]|nr:MAG: hypothetical protein FD123_363 [Bacteroidota bacterium]